MAVQSPPPGWYAVATSILRWWDGQRWADDIVVGASPSSSGTRQTTAAFLRRGRLVAIGTWIVAGLWIALVGAMSLIGGYGILWFLAPVPFLIMSVIMETRMSRRRRLLANGAPPPFGLAPLR